MGLNLDPEKIRQFQAGLRQREQQNVKDGKKLLGCMAAGALIGSVIPGVGTAAGALVGAGVGFVTGTGWLIYDRLTSKGYHGSR